MDKIEQFISLFLEVWRNGISGINISEIIIALFIKKIGYCLPVCSCLFFKKRFSKIEKINAKIKLQRTIEKPSLNIGEGENKPLLVK